ncbi:hypothetical protein T440DRAFT_177780 [Plenodomus tracheiphilus IPT5]|uniref:Uncharacterized protein n=1 Tax=Plenodomus tracheiphilus IPT5 TaxID=1408161 RepID=A0A6A7B139_9PLEO|nr:hypothetical protein T440DRAFT_177780 [Plenodomus tracheiphilus IPT5]
MMYSPRSFPYLQPSSPPTPRSEKMASRTARNRPTARSSKTESNTNTHTTTHIVDRTNEFNKENARHTTANMPPHSQPVVIPSRMPLKSATSTQTVRARGQNGGRPSRSSKTHDPSAVPPAVAALLAVTAIPKMPPRRQRKTSTMDRTISMDELIQEWKQDDSEVPSSYGASPMDILLGRVDESEDDYGSLLSMEQEKESIMTSRSISSESIATMPPSLDYDDPSFISSHWDNLSTPESLGRKSLSERREKAVSSPPKEDCVLDHPLLHFGPEETEEIIQTDVTEIVSSLPTSNERFRSFKSNLTASIQALKSAAKNFSNFTAPSVPPDDFLTRSLLSPSYTSEMRPKHLEGLPSPELRRYLNPQPAPISPTELSMHLHDSLSLDADADLQAPMIQMQTYERRGRSQKNKRAGRNTATDPYSEAGRATTGEPTVRQREPRENSDFLRVIVLEMNMRRVGKLDHKAVGKARIWLPPRKLGSGKQPAVQVVAGVPNRWVGMAAG